MWKAALVRVKRRFAGAAGFPAGVLMRQCTEAVEGDARSCVDEGIHASVDNDQGPVRLGFRKAQRCP